MSSFFDKSSFLIHIWWINNFTDWKTAYTNSFCNLMPTSDMDFGKMVCKFHFWISRVEFIYMTKFQQNRIKFWFYFDCCSVFNIFIILLHDKSNGINYCEYFSCWTLIVNITEILLRYYWVVVKIFTLSGLDYHITNLERQCTNLQKSMTVSNLHYAQMW